MCITIPSWGEISAESAWQAGSGRQQAWSVVFVRCSQLALLRRVLSCSSSVPFRTSALFVSTPSLLPRAVTFHLMPHGASCRGILLAG